MRASVMTAMVVLLATACANAQTSIGDIGTDTIGDTRNDVLADTPADDAVVEDTATDPLDDVLDVVEDEVGDEDPVEDSGPDVLDCSDVICDEHATCTMEVTGPECECDEGWEGDGAACTDVDECAPEPGPCDVHATCTDLDGTFECECDDGWEGTGLVCDDVDECTLGTDRCDTHATCTDVDGGYECDCDDGWMGDGFTCIEDTGGPCVGVNAGAEFNDGSSMGGPWVALKLVAPTVLKVLRIEVWTGEVTGTSSVGIWSHDAGANEPDAELGSGTWPMSATNDWQGADFSSVTLDAGQTYWVVWKPVSSAQSSLQASGTGVDVEYRGSPDAGASWNGPYFNPWKYRLFCE